MGICVRGFGRVFALALGLWGAGLAVASGQVGAGRPLAFDVVSIKPHSSADPNMSIGLRDDAYVATNISLKSMIQNAYGIKMDDLILGAPGWADTERYDFTAKMDPATAAEFHNLPRAQRWDQVGLMLQAILGDRCGLKVHRGKKEVSAYALVVAKGGFKLKEADVNQVVRADSSGIKGATGNLSAGSLMMGPGGMTGHAITIASLAANLGGSVNSFVEDRTGISGTYDVSLRWDPNPERVGMEGADGSSSGSDSEPSLFTAVQDQLGLKLVPAKVAMDTVVVDHIDRSSAD